MFFCVWGKKGKERIGKEIGSVFVRVCMCLGVGGRGWRREKWICKVTMMTMRDDDDEDDDDATARG